MFIRSSNDINRYVVPIASTVTKYLASNAFSENGCKVYISGREI